MERQDDTAVALKSSKWLPQVASFVAVVSAGSFTKAAVRSGVDKAVLSRRVKRLEEVLQVRLLNRTTRSIHVTEAGRRLYDRVADPLSDLMLGVAEAARADVVQGTVRVATISAMGDLWARIASELQQQHPGLHLSLTTADTMVSLVDEGFDLAIRTGHLPDSTLVARRLATWRYVLMASPEWAAAHADLTDPSGVVDHWVLYGRTPNAASWSFERGDQGMDLQVRPVLTAENMFVIRSAVRAGLGVAALPPYVVEDDLQQGRLVRLLPEWRVAHAIPIWAVLPHRSYLPARVETVLAVVERVLEQVGADWLALTE